MKTIVEIEDRLKMLIANLIEARTFDGVCRLQGRILGLQWALEKKEDNRV